MRYQGLRTVQVGKSGVMHDCDTLLKSEHRIMIQMSPSEKTNGDATRRTDYSMIEVGPTRTWVTQLQSWPFCGDQIMFVDLCAVHLDLKIHLHLEYREIQFSNRRKLR